VRHARSRWNVPFVRACKKGKVKENIEATLRGPPACICMRVYYPRGRRWLALPRTPSRAGARRASAPRGVAFISFMSTHVRSSRGNPDCCLRQNLWSPVPRVGATAAHTLISATAHYYYSTDALASRARYGISKTNGHSMRSLPASEGSGDVRAAPARRINSACRPRATKHGPAGAPDAPEGPVGLCRPRDAGSRFTVLLAPTRHPPTATAGKSTALTWARSRANEIPHARTTSSPIGDVALAPSGTHSRPPSADKAAAAHAPAVVGWSCQLSTRRQGLCTAAMWRRKYPW
jgi:hypothetical protein